MLLFCFRFKNEHHDFPKVPWSRLPEITRIAPEYYTALPHYTSYLYVFYRYIFDADVGPSSRVKRRSNQQLDRITKQKAAAAQQALNQVGDLKADGVSSGDAQADKQNEEKMSKTFRYVASLGMASVIGGLVYSAAMST